MRKIQHILALALAVTLGSGAAQANTTIVTLTNVVISAQAKTTTHTVVAGDNDWSIARKYGITVKELHDLNPSLDWNKLKVGAKVKVPAKKEASKPAAKPAAQTNTKTTKIATITKTDVNVRSGPGTNFDQVVQVAKGRTAEVLEAKNGWVKVQFSGGTIGWIRNDMVSISTKTVKTMPVAAKKPEAKPESKPETKVAELPETPAAGSNSITITNIEEPKEEAPAEPQNTGSAMPLKIEITGNDVNIRKEPKTSSPRIVQVTKGRVADVLAQKDGWYKVKFAGGTIGWVHGDFAARTDPDAKDPVVAKSEPKAAGKGVDSLISTAKDQMGIRYSWGGTSRSGFDCSGFVQFVFAKHGVKLPRTSISMSQYGEKVPSRSKLIAGDLVFFITRGSRVSHVGIYIGDNKFIHASSGGGSVRIDSLSKDYYNNRYAGARRVAKFNKALLDDAKAELGQKAIPEPDPASYQGPELGE
ncbi:MAG: C40 family peptidase [Fimbriimonadaceae bacterium]|nr:C40 family peptidase [Fimbriimonadaceae bacterium]